MWQDGNILKTPKTRTTRPDGKNKSENCVENLKKTVDIIGMVNASINLDTLYVMFWYPRERRTFISYY